MEPGASAAELVAAIETWTPAEAAQAIDAAPPLVRQEVLLQAFQSPALVGKTLRMARASRRIDAIVLASAVQFGWSKPPHPAAQRDALGIVLAGLPPSLEESFATALMDRKARKAVDRIASSIGMEEEPLLVSFGPSAVGVLGMAVIVAQAIGYGGRIEPALVARTLERHRREDATPWLGALLFASDALGIESHTKRYLAAYEAAVGERGVPAIVALLGRFELGSAPRVLAWLAARSSPEVEPALLAGLASGHKKVRRASVEGLTTRRVDVARIVPLLGHESPLVRETAADLLERRADPSARPAITTALATERKKPVLAALERALTAAAPSPEGDLETTLAAIEIEHAAGGGDPLPLGDRSGRPLSAHARAVLASRLALESEARADPLLDRIDERLDPGTAEMWAARATSPWARVRLASVSQLDAMGAAMAARAADWTTLAGALGRRDDPVAIAWLEHLAYRGWSEPARRRGAGALTTRRPDATAPPPEPVAASQAHARWLERIEERMIVGAPVPFVIAGLVYEGEGRHRALATYDGWLDPSGRETTPPPNARVVHPATLSSDEAERWADRIAASGLSPPIPQMARRVRRFASPHEAGRTIDGLARALRLDLTTLRPFLEARGYADGPVFDVHGSSPVVTTAERHLGPFHVLVMKHEGRYLRAGEDESMAALLRPGDDARTIMVEVRLGDATIALDALPPAIASELAVDLGT